MSQPHPESVLGLRERFGDALRPLLDDGDAIQVLVPATTTRRGSMMDLRNPTPASVKSRRCLLIATTFAWISAEIRMASREPMFLATGHSRREIEPVADGLTPVRGMDREYFVEPDWSAHVRAANDALAAQRAGRPWSLEACGEWVRQAPEREPLGVLARRFRIGSRNTPF